MVMLKNANFDSRSGLCPANGKKAASFSPGKFPCFGSGCMNQPIVNHQETEFLDGDTMRGSFSGTYDLGSDLINGNGGVDGISFYEAVWHKKLGVGSWVFSHKLKTSNKYPWLMLYLRADATQGYSGGYHYDTRGMLKTEGTSFNLSPRATKKLGPALRPMPDDLPLCVPPNLGPGTKGHNCVYGGFYYDRSSTYGPFGLDTFTFLSEQGQPAIPNVAFGWGNFNDYFHGHDNPIGGIFGLGRGHPTGILQQLNQITLQRFSYCLPPQFEAQSLLHFGEDAQIGGPSVSSAPILGGPDNYYFMKLDAISLNGQRLQIDPSLFMAGGKGIVVDSGSPYSHIVAAAFKVLKQAVVDYFHNMYGWQPMTQKGQTGFDLCYQNIPTVFTSPSVTLHFEGADFELHKPTLFQGIEHHSELGMTILSMDQV